MDFLKEEYLTLRTEIKETKGRIFKLAGLGVVAMPSAYFLAKTQDIDVLVLSLPLIICAIVLLYMSESRALMRCGKYIREKIEPNAGIGWETWLEEVGHKEQDRRIVDKLLTIFFYFLWAVYYIASVYLAVGFGNKPEHNITKIPNFGTTVVLPGYIGFGIVFMWVLIRAFHDATRNK